MSERKIKTKYYDGYSLLNMKDLEGEKPSIFISTSNRSAGKTTFYLTECLKTFKEKHKKFCIIYRRKYELPSAHEIFGDVMSLHPEFAGEMTSTSQARGLFYEIFLDGDSCGYAVSLNNPDELKKYSPIFREVDFLFMDEYQLETGKYLSDEFAKLKSVLLTIARGNGKQSRNVTLVLAGNNVSILNPYYIHFGIYKRLKKGTKKMAGYGWVAEFIFNESASKEIKNNTLFKALSTTEDRYMKYSTEQDCYLVDSNAFIEKAPKGRSKYLFTIVHDNVRIGIREYYDEGIIYASNKPDSTCKTIVTFKASDHNQNTMMLNHYCYLWKNIREAFQKNFLRFSDVKIKNSLLEILGVDLYK